MDYEGVYPSEGKCVYHYTNINNIPSICKYGLLSRYQLEKYHIKLSDLADQEILEKRKDLGLDQFVLFHFFPRTPFAKAICRKRGYDNLAIIMVGRDICNRYPDCKICPSHPLSRSNPPLLNCSEGYSEINWDVIDDYNKKNGHQYDYSDNSIKNLTMAEFLVSGMVDPKYIAFICVYSEEVRDKIVYKYKLNQSFANKIQVRPGMFPKLD